MERSYIYLFVLFVNFYAIRYGDTVEQTTCTFSRSFRANDLGKLRSAQCMGRRGLLHWRESSGKTCIDVPLEASPVFLMTFIIGVKSYMRVNVTLDTNVTLDNRGILRVYLAEALAQTKVVN